MRESLPGNLILSSRERRPNLSASTLRKELRNHPEEMSERNRFVHFFPVLLKPASTFEKAQKGFNYCKPWSNVALLFSLTFTKQNRLSIERSRTNRRAFVPCWAKAGNHDRRIASASSIF